MELITTFVLMLSLIADGYIELASQYRALASPEKKNPLLSQLADCGILDSHWLSDCNKLNC